MALLLCQAEGDPAGSCSEKLWVPTREDLVRSFIAMVQGGGLLMRLGCVQGLRSFNLASGGLLMSFSGSFNLASGGLF